MKRNPAFNRRMRYGGISVLLTVLLITAVVLFNVLFGMLAKRYQWGHSMLPEETVGVTDRCYDLLGSVFSAQEASGETDFQVEILFCDLEENVGNNAMLSYVFQTAKALADRYPDHIKLTYRDIYLDPDSVRPYQTRTVMDPETGEEAVQIALDPTSVILVGENYHRVYALTEFFAFEGGDSSKLRAYNGEKKLAAGILRALNPNAPTVCLTNNHGETYYDYELIYLLDDAGYRLSYLDLMQNEIPADCKLILCFNPNKDLAVPSDRSDVSEPDKLDAFLSIPGNSFLLFLDSETPFLPNLESYLEVWGVTTYRSTQGGVDYRDSVRDWSGSLTSDGATVYGSARNAGEQGSLLADLPGNTVFRDATALGVAPGYSPNADGSYTSGVRTLRGLYEAGSGSVAWANGKAVADAGGRMLMTVTEQTVNGGTSKVGVVSSTRFASEAFLQSAVYGNSDALLRLFRVFGRTPSPEGLNVQPFEATEMSLLTTAQKRNWTIFLTALPALIVVAVAVPILVRRRHS